MQQQQKNHVEKTTSGLAMALKTALGAACLLASVQSQAATSLASLHYDFAHVTVDIFDTAPGDGVTPTLTIPSSSAFYSQGGYYSGYDNSGYAGAYSDSQTSSDPSFAVALGHTSVGGSTNVSNNETGLHLLTTTTNLYDPATGTVAGNQNFSQTSYGSNFNLIFAGKGIYTYTVPYTVTLQTDASNPYSYAGVSASVGVNYTHGADNNSSSDGFSFASSQGLNDGTFSGYLQFSIVNSGRFDSSNVNFSFSANAITYSQVTAPVPEPETYAMMMSGLGVMGFVLRRRKQQAKQVA